MAHIRKRKGYDMREKIITGTRDDGEKTGPMAKARRWAGGHKTMLICIGVGALTAFAAIASCRTGHAGGVKTGCLAGFPDGRIEGYTKGHDAGYADGLADGMEIAADAMKPETISKNTFPVASHVRRLHEGWRRSPAKDAQIAALGKDIPEGYTLVDDQMRTRVTVR